MLCSAHWTDGGVCGSQGRQMLARCVAAVSPYLYPATIHYAIVASGLLSLFFHLPSASDVISVNHWGVSVYITYCFCNSNIVLKVRVSGKKIKLKS